MQTYIQNWWEEKELEINEECFDEEEDCQSCKL
jgi:hypothetical protein